MSDNVNKTVETIDIKPEEIIPVLLRVDEILFIMSAMEAIPGAIKHKPARSLADKLDSAMLEKAESAKVAKKKAAQEKEDDNKEDS